MTALGDARSQGGARYRFEAEARARFALASRRKEQWPARDRRVPPGEECRRRPMWRSRLVDLVHCGRRTSFLSRGFVREQSRLDCLELALGERALRPQPRDFLELLDEFRR